MKCFYHNDADGQCAGHLVAKYNRNIEDLELFPITYGNEFPFDSIKVDETVYIVDYSIEPDEMQRLLAVTPNVVWIDHHKTAIAKYSDFPYEVEGLRYDGLAGCMLTWMWFNAEVDVDDDLEQLATHAPDFVKLISDYDTWTWAFGDDTRHFQTAFVANNLDPADIDAWDTYWLGVGNHIEDGKAMLRFRDGWAEQYMSLGFEAEFEGHRCFAINLGRCNSEYFKSVGDYEIYIPYVYDGNQWTFSLYSTTVDVSEIAKKFGGGGHRGASGFQTHTFSLDTDLDTGRRWLGVQPKVDWDTSQEKE